MLRCQNNSNNNLVHSNNTWSTLHSDVQFQVIFAVVITAAIIFIIF